MATSKTLTPTNVTISIPEFTDQPDQRVNSNCIGKEADAINALQTLINVREAREQVNTSALTEAWVKTANSGIYRVYSGGSKDGTVIADADSNYGVLQFYKTPAPSTNNKYGFLIYHSANSGNVYFRSFWLENNDTTLGWRSGLQQICASSPSVPIARWTKITSYTNGAEWNGSYYCKMGSVVYLRISAKSLTANSNIIVFTIPSGYRPPFEIEFGGFGGNAYLNHAHFKVTNNGNVNVYSADTYAAGFISYPAGE